MNVLKDTTNFVIDGKLWHIFIELLTWVSMLNKPTEHSYWKISNTWNRHPEPTRREKGEKKQKSLLLTYTSNIKAPKKLENTKNGWRKWTSLCTYTEQENMDANNQVLKLSRRNLFSLDTRNPGGSTSNMKQQRCFL